MKRDQQTVNARHAKMLAMVREKGECSVEELADAFQVSLITVRRDLQILEDRGQLVRFHGGASANLNSQSVNRDAKMEENRNLISEYAAELVDDQDYLFINGSTTALNLLKYIEDKAVFVYTNNGNAVDLKAADTVQITITGGTLRGLSKIMTGDFALRNLLTSRADKAFIGCTGISPTGEILCGIPSELAINESMMTHAYEYFILADHTKIGKTDTYASFSLESKGTIITDSLADRQVLNQLVDLGMKVIIVSEDPSDPERIVAQTFALD